MKFKMMYCAEPINCVVSMVQAYDIRIWRKLQLEIFNFPGCFFRSSSMHIYLFYICRAN
jgi:uncharacterized membrane protein YoaT (DUF817 family)